MILQAIQNSNQFYLNNLFNILKVCFLPLFLLALLIPLISLTTNIALQGLIILMQLHLSAVLMLVTADLKNSDLKDTFNYMIKPFFYLGPLIAVALVVGLLALFGFSLFIIPGIFLLGKFVYAQYYLLIRNKTVTESLELSWRLSNEKSWRNGFLIIFAALAVVSLTVTFLTPVVGLITSNESFSLFIIQILGFFFTIYLNVLIYTLFLMDENHETKEN